MISAKFITRRTIGLSLKIRNLHITSMRYIHPKNAEEIRIPVPWGYIAGKWWGSKNIEPILAVHGWQDNAGSWDPLAMLLPQEYSLLAIDLPGNGLSSHMPSLQNYHFYDAIGFLKMVKKHFGLGKLNLLGHSGGSFKCFLFSCIFPQDVKTYFGIDFLLHCSGNEEKIVSKMGKLIDQKIKLSLRDHDSSKRYTREEALNIWIQGTKHSLNEETGQILMKRGVKEMEDGKVIFSRDQRVKSFDLNEPNLEQIYTLASEISCDICLVKCLKGKLFDGGIRHCPEVLNIIKSRANSFNLHAIDGGHHLHMDMPENILPLLLDLIKSDRDRIVAHE